MWLDKDGNTENAMDASIKYKKSIFDNEGVIFENKAWNKIKQMIFQYGTLSAVNKYI